MRMSLQKTIKDTQKQREEVHVKTEAETGVMLLQAMECKEPPEAGRDKEVFSPRASGGSMTLPTSWFQTPGLYNNKNKFLLFYITKFVVI